MDIRPFTAIFRLPTVVVFITFVGCRTAEEHRRLADRSATEIVRSKRLPGVQSTENFTIERPSDRLRSRLSIEQELPHISAAPKTPPTENSPRPSSLCISLNEALEIGARNNSDYQEKKEDIFRAALNLDLQQDRFRNSYTGRFENLLQADSTAGATSRGVENSAVVGVSKTLLSGVELTGLLAVDVVKLLTLGDTSSLGVLADATISIPLLRGAGRDIVAEPMTQAEREVIYAIYEFEQFKKTFAVEVARQYYSVLTQSDQVVNAEENYRSLAASARRTRRLADAGRISVIQVDQAAQDELRARDTWIRALGQYGTRLDTFRNFLGLPPDAEIELDIGELETIRASRSTSSETTAVEPLPADHRPPLTIESDPAIHLALDNRLDLRIALGRAYDAQRAIGVAADRLRPELNLVGTATFGESRSLATVGQKNARLGANDGLYAGLLTLDLPLERRFERNEYRDRFIQLDRAIRDVQSLEDEIKLSVRNRLRELGEYREGYRINARSVAVAKQRIDSVTLFLEAGRAQIRDLLEARAALLAAQNGFTSALVNYRIAELELQRDTGVLAVDQNGLWTEYAAIPGVEEPVGE